MVSHDRTYSSQYLARRTFILALFISLFLHLVSIFTFKVKFIEMKYPGQHWVNVDIKDDLWFEAGIELPSNLANPDLKEMAALFHYPIDSDQLNLLRPEKPSRLTLEEKNPIVPLEVKPPFFSEEKYIAQSVRTAPFLLDIPTILKENSDKMKESVVDLLAKDKVLPEQAYVLSGPAKKRSIEHYRLPDFCLRPLVQDNSSLKYANIKIKFWMNSDGSIGFTRLLHSSGNTILDAHALLTLKSWKFNSVDKHDADFWGIIEFRFYDEASSN